MEHITHNHTSLCAFTCGKALRIQTEWLAEWSFRRSSHTHIDVLFTWRTRRKKPQRVFEKQSKTVNHVCMNAWPYHERALITQCFACTTLYIAWDTKIEKKTLKLHGNQRRKSAQYKCFNRLKKLAIALHLNWISIETPTLEIKFILRSEKKLIKLSLFPHQKKTRKRKIIINFQQFYGILINLRVDESSKRLIA